MQLKYSKTHNLFGWKGAYDEKHIPEQAGFTWNSTLKAWVTGDPITALRIKDAKLDDAAKEKLEPIIKNINESSMETISNTNIPCPPGLIYRPYQEAGITLAEKRKVCMIADEQGLGKTIQVIGLANLLGLTRILVVCPASLRLNWKSEFRKWHLVSLDTTAIMSGKDQIPKTDPVIISYDLVTNSFYYDLLMPWELIVLDEAHYLKNPDALRTQMLLGLGRYESLVNYADRRVFLTGTPIPNKPAEFFPILKTQTPATIKNKGYWKYVKTYSYVVKNGFGVQIKGAKNQEDLYLRLRSSFMIRRLKSQVLKDLPPKQHKLVIFPADKSTRKVLKKESDFSSSEIIEHGAPVGSALPELRREMGEAMAPMVVDYVKDLLESVNKVVLFAHHKSVVDYLTEHLTEYGVVQIVGKTPGKKRQENVDAFQKDPVVRVLVGHIVSAGTGWTLTASSDVVFAEASWVPGENDQAIDRTHRIGQQNKVLAHFLVVEGSISAAVLSSALKKKEDCKPIIDKE